MGLCASSHQQQQPAAKKKKEKNEARKHEPSKEEPHEQKQQQEKQHPGVVKPEHAAPKDLAAAPQSPTAGLNYAVIVNVCQGRNIKKMDLLSESDPYVRVIVGTEEYKTAVVNDSNKPVWNDTFMFASPEKVSSVSLICMDKDTVTRDDHIGSAEIKIPDDEYEKSDDSMAFEWVPLRKGDQTNGEVQVQVRAMEISYDVKNQIQHYSFTHMLQVEISRAEQLTSRDLGADNDAYVVVAWGNKQFKTHVVHSAEPVWDQSVYFWVNEPTQRAYVTRFTVMDKDPKHDDEVGTAYVSVADLFETPGKFVEHKLALREEKADRDTTMVRASNADEGGGMGFLTVRLRMVPKETAFTNFFDRVVEHFDAAGDGTLSRNEVWAMLEALKADMTPDEFEMLWTASDRDGNDVITRDEGVLLMRALVFINPSTTNAVLHFLQGGLEAVQGSLMEGINQRVDPARRTEIEVMDRENGLIVKENIPGYIKVALKSMFNSKTGRTLSTSKQAQKIMYKLSVNQGRKFDDPESRKDIPAFVELHNLDLSEVERAPEEYKTFNEFFYRGLRAGARPLASPDDPTVAVSPADCRLMVFQDVNEATDFWIKGDKFTVENVFGPTLQDLAQHFKGGALVIARLAPQDYHRWHIPVGGTLGPRTKIDGALYTVNPIAVNQNVNVYTHNKREVCEIDSPEFGKVALVAIGATMVGSINILGQPGTTMRKGDVHGFFAFGGSTVLIFFERDRIELAGDLVANSRKKMETLIKVNTVLGKAVAPKQ